MFHNIADKSVMATLIIDAQKHSGVENIMSAEDLQHSWEDFPSSYLTKLLYSELSHSVQLDNLFMSRLGKLVKLFSKDWEKLSLAEQKNYQLHQAFPGKEFPFSDSTKKVTAERAPFLYDFAQWYSSTHKSFDDGWNAFMGDVIFTRDYVENNVTMQEELRLQEQSRHTRTEELDQLFSTLGKLEVPSITRWVNDFNKIWNKLEFFLQDAETLDSKTFLFVEIRTSSEKWHRAMKPYYELVKILDSYE